MEGGAAQKGGRELGWHKRVEGGVREGEGCTRERGVGGGKEEDGGEGAKRRG